MTTPFLRVLVVFHIFYRDQIPWFLHKLSHISHCQWDMVVTGPEFYEEDKQQILAFKPGTNFIVTENAGYDVWPFIQVLQQTDLSRYDILVKLHTKGQTKGDTFHYGQYHFSTRNWRDGLVNALLENNNRWKRILDIFQKKKEVGMVCCRKYIILSGMMPEDKELLEDEMKHLGIECADHHFCAGTMFAVRPQIFQPILMRGLAKEDFAAKQKSHSSGTLAHVYERIFGILVTASGHSIYPIGYKKTFFLTQLYYAFIEPAMKWIFEINRDVHNRKYLRVLGFRFFLERPNTL